MARIEMKAIKKETDDSATKSKTPRKTGQSKKAASTVIGKGATAKAAIARKHVVGGAAPKPRDPDAPLLPFSWARPDTPKNIGPRPFKNRVHRPKGDAPTRRSLRLAKGEEKQGEEAAW